jgi:hypothetical protein
MKYALYSIGLCIGVLCAVFGDDVFTRALGVFSVMLASSSITMQAMTAVLKRML